MGVMGVAVAMEKVKVTTLRKGPIASGVTATKSQVQSEASTRLQSGIHIGSQSNPLKSLATKPIKKHALATIADAASKTKNSKVLSEEELSTSLASTIFNLPQIIQVGEVIDYNNVNVIF